MPLDGEWQVLRQRDLTDVYYSMGSGKADFDPHQFRPVLKYVEFTGRRLLIADEVGLGRTISHSIWKYWERAPSPPPPCRSAVG